PAPHVHALLEEGVQHRDLGLEVVALLLEVRLLPDEGNLVFAGEEHQLKAALAVLRRAADLVPVLVEDGVADVLGEPLQHVVEGLVAAGDDAAAEHLVAAVVEAAHGGAPVGVGVAAGLDVEHGPEHRVRVAELIGLHVRVEAEV
ncbi:MAG: hypothetical protein ACK559_28500, partial [bacterium]